MKYNHPLFIFLLFLISSCQDFNSNSFDKEKSYVAVIDTSTAEGKRLNSAYQVLKNNCMSCHTGYHSVWLKFNTSELWQNENLIIAGDANASEIMIRLKNNGGDMPLNNSPIQFTDLIYIEDWINGL